MDEQTCNILREPISPEQIKQRQGNFGKTLNYIDKSLVIERLNLGFSHEWSFEILNTDIRLDVGEVITHARISAGGVTKEGYGSSQIKLKRDSKEIVGLSDSIKASCSDALKVAAVLFGIGLHLYQQDTPDAVRTEAGINPAQPRSQSQAPGQARSNAKTARIHSNQEITQKGIGTVTDKQLNYLRRLANKQDISEKDLNEYCRRVYAANLDAISKSEASFLIESLRRGKIPYYDKAA